MSWIEKRGPYRRAEFAQVLWKAKRFPVISGLLLLPALVCGLFGFMFYPHDPTAMNLALAFRPPAWLPGGDWSYLLGTDQLGRDVLSRLIEGARISLMVAVFGVCFAGFFGICMGIIPGYFGGKVDNVIMRIVDAQMSIPTILLIILLAARRDTPSSLYDSAN